MTLRVADYLDGDNKFTTFPLLSFTDPRDKQEFTALSAQGKVLFILTFVYVRSPLANTNAIRSVAGSGDPRKANRLLMNGWPSDPALLKIMTSECLEEFKQMVRHFFSCLL